MASSYNRELQESTLFELFESNTYNDTDKSLRLALATINDKLLRVKDGTWSKTRLNNMKKVVTSEIDKAYAPAYDSLNKELLPIASTVRVNMLNPSYETVPLKDWKEKTL